MSDAPKHWLTRFSDRVRNELVVFVRKRGALPRRAQMLNFARKRALEFRAQLRGHVLDPETLSAICKENVAWVCKHYDPAKARPAPTQSRAEKALRDDRIAAAFRAAKAEDSTISTRKFAATENLSHSMVARAVKKAGIAPKINVAVDQLRPSTQRLSVFLNSVVRSDRLIVQDRSLIEGAQIQGGLPELKLALSDLARVRQGLKFVVTDDPAIAPDAAWILFSRRNCQTQELLDWYRQKEEKRLSKPNRWRPSCNSYLYALGAIPLDQVHFDLWSVLQVATGRGDARSWRRLVEVSFTPQSAAVNFLAADRFAVWNAVNGGLKLDTADVNDQLRSMPFWILPAQGRSSFRTLLQFVASELEAANPAHEILNSWFELTGYLERVRLEELPGRSYPALQQLLKNLERRGEVEPDDYAHELAFGQMDIERQIAAREAETAWQEEEEWADDEDVYDEDYYNPEGYIYPPEEDI